jgi:hypothetical protein
MCWSTCAVKNSVSRILYGLVPPFSRVLVMLVRFTLPTIDTECMKDIFYFITNNGLNSVTKKAVGSTSLNNVIFHGVRKLVILLNTMYISNRGRSSYKYYCSSRTVKDSWYVGVHNITGDIFIASVDI